MFLFFVTHRTEFINFTLNSTSSKTTPPLETFLIFFFSRACFPPNVYNKPSARFAIFSLYLNNNNRRQNSNTTICGWVPKQMFSYNNNPIVYYVFIFFLFQRIILFVFFLLSIQNKKQNWNHSLNCLHF